MADVTFSSVTKEFPGGATAVERLDLHVADGELLVLVGPSGSGKTTALRLVAGLEEATDGEIAIGGRVVDGVHPMDRDIAMVFQNYALYPHMTVAENIGFGLKLRGRRKAEVAQRVGEAAATLALTELLGRKPAQLSGGQRQRVAMGRAIVREPAVFLMDEPLSNLDAKLRVQMRAEIQRLQHRLATTTIYVTHDQTEAMTMGDRVAVMRQGRLVQVDTPQALYERPTDLFVAGFIGSPAMNVVRARLSRSNGSILAAFGSTTLELPARAVPPSVAARDGGEVIVGLRPEHLEDAALAPADGRPLLRAPVSLAEPVGSQVIVHLELDAPPVVTRDTIELARDAGLEATAQIGFTACLGPRTSVGLGQMLTLAVDPSALYFFDADTEVALA
jgi:multiple sugar transport system ATP-binding protein